MPRKRSTPYVSSGVNFDPDVLEYVDRLAEEDERTRSQTINRIIKEHARIKGHALAARSKQEPVSAAR